MFNKAMIALLGASAVLNAQSQDWIWFWIAAIAILFLITRDDNPPSYKPYPYSFGI